MKRITCFLTALVLFNIISCKKPKGDSVLVDLKLSVVNAQGEDLLNSVYNTGNITLSHIIDGKNVPYVKNEADGIYKDGLYVLKVFPGNYNEPNITLIQFGTSKPDTIRRQFTRGDNYTFLTKIWFNGELKYSDVPVTNSKERRFTIVK